MTSIANVTPNIEPNATSAETTSDSTTTKSSTRADRTAVDAEQKVLLCRAQVPNSQTRGTLS
jgi:hypothetical protein